MASNIIQWFPGHMAKTRRMITENLSKVDLVIEVLDARIPASSANPELHKWTGEKPVLTVLSKTSLADPEASAAWEKKFRAAGRTAVFIDCLSGAGFGAMRDAAAVLTREKRAKYDAKGMTGRNIRAMVVGIPNVGKSSLINKLSGGKSAKVENRPGVTVDKQWVTTSVGLELLDMPGVLWPKFEDQRVGELLSATGAIKDDIMDLERIAYVLTDLLRALYPDLLSARYRLGDMAQYADLEAWDLFGVIAKKRGLLISGGEPDTERASRMLVDEFRAGKIGRITLER